MRRKNTGFFYSGKGFLAVISILLLISLFQDKTLLYDVAGTLAYGCSWIQAQFNFIGDFDSDWLVWAPFILVTVGMILGMWIYPDPPQPLRIIAISALALSHTLYILFRTFNTLRFNTVGNGAVTLLLWLFEVMFYICSLSLYVQLLFPVDRRSAADIYEKDILSGRYQPWVDVFIPTHSESVAMVRRTITGCQALEYAHKRIYLLDDGRRPEMRELAQQIGCFYITRVDNLYAKAGNINNALEQTNGELVAIFDADCIPTKNFLTRTVGFFQEDGLALIITAQSFYNANMFSHNAMSLTEQSRFFRHSQKGRDRFNAILCYGTCFVVTRSSLKNIGGIPAETLCEDWAASIKLQAAGYKTYFLDEVLGAGAVAESMGEYVQQRLRWTQGTIQSCFASTNPFKIKGLTFMQRFIHSYGILHYLLHPFYLLLVFVPLGYFFFGYSPFYTSSSQFWLFFMPFISLNCLTFSWISHEYTAKLTAIVNECFMSLPVSLAAIKTILRPFGWRFRVTRKSIYRIATAINWFIGTPLLVFFALLVLGIAYGYRVMYWYDSQELFYFLFFWCILRIFGIWVGIYASFDFPQKRRAMRFEHNLSCLFYGKEPISGKTVDISEHGLLFKSEGGINGVERDSKGI
ncbi:MAG: glycosyltransferase, partial [Candidatus Omnitrophica bacterium]|nr:glycosyltransferase [Candidatus Omnitrophota bacterium]